MKITAYALVCAALKAVKPLFPALIPSWRFFDAIAPSPRIEFAVMQTPMDIPGRWSEFRSKPAHLSFGYMLKSLVWNPRGNETLFLVSCAERILENQAEHSVLEIAKRIRTELQLDAINSIAAPYLQYRLICISRQGSELHQEVMFMSPVIHCAGEAIS